MPQHQVLVLRNSLRRYLQDQFRVLAGSGPDVCDSPKLRTPFVIRRVQFHAQWTLEAQRVSNAEHGVVTTGSQAVDCWFREAQRRRRLIVEAAERNAK